MGVFNGYHIALEATSCVPLKRKQELRQLITSNDGVISFIVTKKCKLLVTLNDEEKARESFKCQTALKFNIPVVESRYVLDCIRIGCLVDPDPYILLGNTRNQMLSSGVIAAPQGKTSATKKKKKSGFINLNAVKVWNPSDKNCPLFPEDSYEVAKSIQLIKSDKKLFFVAEIHVASSASADQFKYRVFTHSGMLTSQSSDKELNPDFGKKECRFTNSADECLSIYSRICDLQTEAPVLFTKTREYLGRNVGSKKFQQMQLESLLNTEGLDKEVSELVEHIWREALGELQEILAVPIKSIKSEQVDRAESVLLELKRCLVDVDSIHQQEDDKINQLSDEFYAQLSHKAQHQITINTKHLISRKQELCQLIRDVVSVSEGTDWSQRCPSQSKYKALRCHIKHLMVDDPAYIHINQHVLNSQQQKSSIEVLSIFEVSRSVEELVFNETMENKRLLFHSSHVHNFVGILSRGLLLPKVIVDDCGGIRTDVGMLGSGIYFADDASTSAKYSKPSNCKGSRLMLVNEVGLGKCLDLVKYRTDLNAAPEGYDSVHGVKATDDVRSDFKDDEYAIYNTNQQRLQYLVEFKASDDVLKVLDIDNRDKIAVDEEGNTSLSRKNADLVDLDDIQNIPDPTLKVKAGLLSDSTGEIPLTAVHVKARLIDLAAQVVVFQHYKNQSNIPIEAKYVFPLDEMAAVCGFEAFINDKHIIGEVKEKETAHREYREAISQGHGAYLMDQNEETPDVFTVSVGNLPPWCDVMIKITYVAELQMEGESISFRLPSCVAPWKKSAALDAVTQGELETVKITEDQIETSVQVAVEMPFKINKIECPTHRIRSKKTDTKAVVEMQKNQPINEGFHLLICLAEIHVPRMWVERLPDNPDSHACMLTFYPEFEAAVCDNFEVVFLLDLSNSMKGNSLLEAKKILLLSLLHLPESCFFNVFVFGTDYDELFPCCRARTSANVRLAEKFVMNQDASLGNTEVIRPLSSLYLLSPEDGFRNLFLVSDGHISNEKVSLETIQLNCRHSRLFTFGVGSVANHHMLRSLAAAGCGYYEYFNSKTKSKWETKVRNQLSKAAQPNLSSIQVDWVNFNNIGTPVQAPAEIMTLFNGCRQVVYGFVPDCTQATLRAVIDNQEVSTMVSTSDLNITTGKILHQLTARAIIQDWSDGQLASERIEHEILKKNRKNYIIKLSKEFSIITQFTSFVAVEKREEGEIISASALENFNKLVQKDSVDVLDYMSWESISCRIHIKTFDRPSFSLDMDLSETFDQLKSKISEFVSKPVNLYHCLSGISAADERSLWDQKMENGATIYALDNDLNPLCGAGMLIHAESFELNDLSQLFDMAERKLFHPELDLKWENRDPAVALENKFEEFLSRHQAKMLKKEQAKKERAEKERVRRAKYSSSCCGGPTKLLSERFNILPGSASYFTQDPIPMAAGSPDMLRSSPDMGPVDGITSKVEHDFPVKSTGAPVSKAGHFKGMLCRKPRRRQDDLVCENLGLSVSTAIIDVSEASLTGLADEQSCLPVVLHSQPMARLELPEYEEIAMEIGGDSSKDRDAHAASKDEKDEKIPSCMDFATIDLDSRNFSRLGRSISNDTSTRIWPPHSLLPALKKQLEEEAEVEFECQNEISDAIALGSAMDDMSEISGMILPPVTLEETPSYAPAMLPASAMAESPCYSPAPPDFLMADSVSHYYTPTLSSYVLLEQDRGPPPTRPPQIMAKSPRYAPTSPSYVQSEQDQGALEEKSRMTKQMPALASALEASEQFLIDSAPSPPSAVDKVLDRSTILTTLSPLPPQTPYFQRPPLVEPSPAQQPLMPPDSPPLPLEFRSLLRQKALRSRPRKSDIRDRDDCFDDSPAKNASLSSSPSFKLMSYGLTSSSGPVDDITEPSQQSDTSDMLSLRSSVPEELPSEDSASIPLFRVVSSSGKEGRGGGRGLGGGGGIYRHRRVLLSSDDGDDRDLSVSQPSQEDAECEQSAISMPSVPAFEKQAKRGIEGEIECLNKDERAVDLTQGMALKSVMHEDKMQTLELSGKANYDTMALPALEELSCYELVSAVAEWSCDSAMSPALAEPPCYAPTTPSYVQSEQDQGAHEEMPQMTEPVPAVASALESPELCSIDIVAATLSLTRLSASLPPPLPPRMPTGPPPPPLQVEKKMVQKWTPPLEDISRGHAELSSARNEGRKLFAFGSSIGETFPSVWDETRRKIAFHPPVSATKSDEEPVCSLFRRNKKKKKTQHVFKGRIFPEVTRTIGIEILGWVMTPVFERRTKLPDVRVLYLTTCSNYQNSVRIKVYKGEHQLTSYNVLLDEIEMTGLESAPQGRMKIEVKCEIDVYGLLTFTVISHACGISCTRTVQAVDDDLSEEEIEASVRSAEETAPVVPLDLSSLRASGQLDGWDVCLYEEKIFTLGDGALKNDLNINTGRVSWTMETWEQLLKQHCELPETDSICWELDEQLGNLICVDVKKFSHILDENGLLSLGHKAASDVRRLLANCLVLYRIFYESLGSDRVFSDNADLQNYVRTADFCNVYDAVPAKFESLITKAAQFCLNVSESQPLIYARLNLGRSWPEAALNLLGEGIQEGRHLA